MTRFPNSYGASNLCVGGGMGVNLGEGLEFKGLRVRTVSVKIECTSTG